MKIIIAPDSFKNALRANEVAQALAAGWKKVRKEDEIIMLPMSDGGEGLCDALGAALNGKFADIAVHDSLMRPRQGRAVVSGECAVIESAEANGIELLKRSELSPLSTTTYGVGEIFRTLLHKYHCRNFIIGIGGSATVDGGVGMFQALGYRFLRADGSVIPPGAGGGGLSEIAKIDAGDAEPLLKDIQIQVACDVNNVLCGSNGSAAVFGPQKGATPEMVKRLDENLRHFARLWGENGEVPGDGAAGGLGFALRMLGGKMESGAGIVMRETGFVKALAGADLVITGEGCSDDQTACGKLCAVLAHEAEAAGVPTVLVSGALRGNCTELEKLFSGCFSISRGVCTLDEALASTRENLEKTASALAAFIR